MCIEDGVIDEGCKQCQSHSKDAIKYATFANVGATRAGKSATFAARLASRGYTIEQIKDILSQVNDGVYNFKPSK